MHVAFFLSMPGVNSWDGKWSGEGKVYAIVKSFRAVPAHLVEGNYGHNFGDGWYTPASA